MFFLNGFVYGGTPEESIRVDSVKALHDKILLIVFNNGEERLFDATILRGPVFEPLSDETVFAKCSVDHGVVTWKDGEIDCAPEFMYENSYEYPKEMSFHG